MAEPTFAILDVFAEKKYAGNQLAVVRGGGDLGAEQMQRIAKEMNYSETTFILSETPREGGYDVRIFTPEVEVPFAGHPTLGTAQLIRDEIAGGAEKVTLNLGVGPIEVTFEDSGLAWMKQIDPEFGEAHNAGEVAGVLSLDVAAIDTAHPLREVSTGLPFIICPLRSLDAVRRCRVDLNLFEKLTEKAGARAVFVFAPETYGSENDINARMFAPLDGVAEDPATGSANGCLAGYLVKYRYFDSDRIAARVEQGFEIGRPSILHLRAEKQGDAIDVRVGGRVFKVAEGRFV